MTNQDLQKAVSDFLAHEDDSYYVCDFSENPIRVLDPKIFSWYVTKLSHHDITYTYNGSKKTRLLKDFKDARVIRKLIKALHSYQDNIGKTNPANSIENSGGPCSYYVVKIDSPLPTKGQEPYLAECGDIIEALGMDWNEANEFKAIWRTAAARTLDKQKANNDALRDTEKRVFFSQRSLDLLRHKTNK